MSNQKEPAGNGRRIIIIAAFVVLLVALAVCIVLLLSKKEVSNDSPVAETRQRSEAERALERGFVSEDSADDIMEEMANKVADGMFECEMTMSWTFQDGKSVASNAYVANSENNLHTLYFDVYDNSTDELLYSSPMMPVGTELREIQLEKELPAGDYSALVMYTLVDENYEEVSQVGFNITISILK